MKKLVITLIVIVSSVSSPGYGTAWEKSFHWSWEPWGFDSGAFFLRAILLMIVSWVAAIIGIVYFIKWVIATCKRHGTKPEETALDILKKRYVKGEISREEFERMKQDIQ